MVRTLSKYELIRQTMFMFFNFVFMLVVLIHQHILYIIIGFFFSDLYVSDFAFGICPLVFQVTILHIKIKLNGISYFNIKVREERCNKKVNIAKNSSLEVFKKEAINKTLNMFSFWQSAGSQRSISRERRAGWMFNPVKFAGYSCFTFEIIIHTVNSPVVSVNKKSIQTLSDTFEIMC